MISKKLTTHLIAAIAAAFATASLAQADVITTQVVNTAAPALLPASDVQLVANTVTGDVQLVTTVTGGLPIDGYEIDTASGSLVPGNLHSITSVDASFFLFDAKTTQLSEGSFSTYTLNPSFDLGNIFNINGKRDFSFLWGDTNSNTYTGTVDYTSVPEPASLGLLALSGLIMIGGLTIRRRIKV